MVVITISGKAESGKDFVAKILKNKLEDLHNKVLIVHYADYLKYVASQYFGWNGVKDDAGRTILQKVGTDIVRKRNPELWVDVATMLIKVLAPDYDFVLIPDTRFPNEIVKMQKEFGSLSLEIQRLGWINSLSDEQKAHPSETALDGWDFDYTIKSMSGERFVSQEVDRFISWYDLIRR